MPNQISVVPFVEKKIFDFIPQPRPMVVRGATYRIGTPVGVAFITLNTNGDTQSEPLEIFINIGKNGSDIHAMAESLSRMISMALEFSSHLPIRDRIQKIISQLQGIGGEKTIGFGKDKVTSLPDAVAKVLMMHYKLNTDQEKN